MKTQQVNTVIISQFYVIGAHISVFWCSSTSNIELHKLSQLFVLFRSEPWVVLNRFSNCNEDRSISQF